MIIWLCNQLDIGLFLSLKKASHMSRELRKVYILTLISAINLQLLD